MYNVFCLEGAQQCSWLTKVVIRLKMLVYLNATDKSSEKVNLNRSVRLGPLPPCKFSGERQLLCYFCRVCFCTFSTGSHMVALYSHYKEVMRKFIRQSILSSDSANRLLGNIKKRKITSGQVVQLGRLQIQVACIKVILEKISRITSAKKNETKEYFYCLVENRCIFQQEAEAQEAILTMEKGKKLLDVQDSFKASTVVPSKQWVVKNSKRFRYLFAKGITVLLKLKKLAMALIVCSVQKPQRRVSHELQIRFL